MLRLLRQLCERPEPPSHPNPTPRPPRTPHGHTVAHLTVAPGARLFACAAGALVSVFAVAAEGGAPPQRTALGPLPGGVQALRFARSGSRLLACYNGGVTQWDLTRGAEEGRALDLPYAGACLSGDAAPAPRGGEWVVAGCHDATVHIFQLIREKGGARLDVSGVAAVVVGGGGGGGGRQGVQGGVRVGGSRGAAHPLQAPHPPPPQPRPPHTRRS